VYAVLKERILSQEIELGARLRDEELASQLEVSRTPVREALMRLHREGLVDVVPRSGTMVRMFTESDVEQIYDIRSALESLAVRRAAKALRPAQIRQLQHMHVAAEAAYRRKNFEPALDFDRHMHRVVLEACGNRRLQELMGTINDFVALFRNLGARLPAHRGFNYRHREIVRALVRRDSDAAARSLAEHIEGAKKQLLRALQERQILKALAPATQANGRRTSNRPPTRIVNPQLGGARRAAPASRRPRGGGSAR